MSKLFHGIFHGAMIGLQVANAAGKFVPFPGNIIAAGGIAVVQGAVALKHHREQKRLDKEPIEY